MSLRKLLRALATSFALLAGSAGAQPYTGTLTVETAEAGILTAQLKGIVGGHAPIQHAWTQALDGKAVRIGLTGGGPNCSLSAAEWMALPPGARATLPTGTQPPPGGLLRLATENCTGGGTATFTLTYPEPLAAGTRYYKYGPTSPGGTDIWFEVPVTVSGNSLSFSVTDGQLGDSDFQANGEIQDPGAILMGGPLGVGNVQGIPVVNGPLALVLSALLVAVVAVASRRSSSSRWRLQALAFLIAASLPSFDGYRHAFALPLGQGNSVASLAPHLLVFRVETLGQTSAPQTVVLRNSTAGPLSIGVITISEHFRQENDCPATLAAGASCNIAIRFQPTVAPTTSDAPVLFGHHPTTLIASGQAQTLTLSGRGFASTDIGLVAGNAASTHIIGTTAAQLTVPGNLLTQAGLRTVQLRTAAGQLSNPLVVAVDPVHIPEPTQPGTAWSPGETPTLLASSDYLFAGTDPVQKDVQPGALRGDVAAGVLGYVTQRDGSPLSGVTVSVKNQAGVGWTLSRADGRFDLIVNGAEDIVFEYRKPGFLPLQRPVLPLPQGYTRAPDVVMIPYDANVAPVESTAASFTVARGSTETDDSGTRHAAIFFPPGTTATLRRPDGHETTLTRFHARATEYTVGNNGPQAMPGPLPEHVAYTYAAELSLDEAVASGASVHFNQRVALYVENFLGFPVGAIVPVGWYDLSAAAWQASDNGRVIQILSIADGRAILAVDDNGQASSTARLAELGISDGERVALAEQYAPGTTLWRVTMDHFSPWDCNWPYAPPPEAQHPDTSPDGPDPTDDETPECPGCLINPVRQTMRESVPIVGTPYRLHYSSAHAQNYDAGNTLKIRVTPPTALQNALGVRVTVTVAGVSYVRHFPTTANQFWEFQWNGRDFLGRQQVSAVSNIEIAYIYPAIYQLGSSAFDRAWGQVGGGGGITVGDRAMNRIELAARYQSIVYSSENKLPLSLSIGGWSLDVQRATSFYDMIRGDGTRTGRRFVDPYRTSLSTIDQRTNNFLIPEEDGLHIYEFDDRGRHLRTHAFSGAVVATFGYDGDGRIAAITDLNGRTTRIERDGGGAPLAIVAPDGQRTVLASSGGMLSSATNPAGEQYRFEYDGQLLTRFIRPSGAANTYTYDDRGRLIGDVQPQGGGWNIDRQADDAHTAVTMTSAEGVSEIFDHLTGSAGYSSVGADGASHEYQRSGSNAIATMPDGSAISFYVAPFKIGEAIYETSSTMSLPAGQVRFFKTAGYFQRITTVGMLGTVGYRSIDVAAGRVRTSTYNPATRTYANFVSGEVRHQISLDASGRPHTLQAVGMAPATLRYDPDGRLQTFSTSANAVTRSHQLTYHTSGPQAGFLATHTDPAGRSETFAWDAAGRLTDWIDLGGQRLQYGYDLDGNLSQVTLPSGAIHRYHYDGVGDTTRYEPPNLGNDDATDYTLDRDRRLVSLRLPGGQTVTRTYGVAGRLAREAGDNASRSYTYLPGGRLATATAHSPAGSTTQTLAYNGPLPTGITWSGAIEGHIGYRYFNDVLPYQIQVGSQNIPIGREIDGQPNLIGPISYRYDQGGRLTDITTPAVVSNYTYTPFGEIASIDHSINGSSFWRIDYTWDVAGHLAQKRDTRQGQTYTWRYGYNAAGRLIEVRLEDEVVSRYGYDVNGNRITEDFGAGERTGTVDAQDRLQACGNRTYQYDPQGRRTATDCNGFLTRYRYNGLGEMTGVELPNGNVIDYLYDAMGQRIGRKKNGVLEQGWLYQSRLKIAGELDGSNALRAVFLQGHGPNVPDGMVKAGHTYRLLTDHLGSVGYVVNIDTGEVSQALEYDEWGKLLRDSNPGYQPFGYAGGLYDPDTGLVRFGMRDYDPREGRWLTKDPIGLQGGYNVYAYVGGNPLTWIDPEGLANVNPGGSFLGPGGGGAGGGVGGPFGGGGARGPAWPSSPAGMDNFLKLPGRVVPDGPRTPGRGKVEWCPSDKVRITYEQHPYHPNAPDWHRGPHWHLDTPGQPHQRFSPGDPMPGY